MLKKFLTLTAAFVACAMLLTGCAQTTVPDAVDETVRQGQITLSVNPEIVLTYDENGSVIDLKGRNVDGESIVAKYPDYIGKDCDVVLADLTSLIKEAGYFIEDIDGNKKNIVIQIEPGSHIPNGSFLVDIETAVSQSAESGSNIVTIDSDDYDDRYTKQSQPSPYISLDKAKEIALAQAHLSAQDVQFSEKEFDFDDGLAIYELEFTSGGIEYEYDVDARTGRIIGAHNSAHTYKDDSDYGPLNDGVTDYSFTDYGPDNDGYTDYGNSDYGPNNDGVTDYDDTDYGPLNDGITDYDDTDYGPNNDGVTDYDDTDYGPNNDGVTDYDDTDYGPYNDGVTDYSAPSGGSDYGNSGYDQGSDYGNSGYDGDSGYDD